MIVWAQLFCMDIFQALQVLKNMVTHLLHENQQM